MRTPATMRAMVLERCGGRLVGPSFRSHEPGPGQVLLRVAGLRGLPDRPARGGRRAARSQVARSIPGPRDRRRVVGSRRRRCDRLRAGERVGVPWLGWTCGDVPLLPARPENLCDGARFTGYTRSTAASPSTRSPTSATASRFPRPLRRRRGGAAAVRRPDRLPLLPDGGRRRRRASGSTASARPPISSAQVAVHQGQRGLRLHPPGGRPAHRPSPAASVRSGPVAPSERPPDGTGRGDPASPRSARWCRPPCGRWRKGGIGGLRRHPHERHPRLPLPILWEERVLRSVANLERRDGEELLALAARIPLRTEAETMPLSQANAALARLRDGDLEGALVLVP